MEIMIAWFWAVKLIFASIVAYACYIAFWKKKFKSPFWNVIAGALLIFSFIMPVKIGVQTTQMQNMQNQSIEQNRVIPPKITDNSFKNGNKIDGIKEKDLK